MNHVTSIKLPWYTHFSKVMPRWFLRGTCDWKEAALLDRRRTLDRLQLYSYLSSSSPRAVSPSDLYPHPICRVSVGNLPWKVTGRQLKDHMMTSGCEVTRAYINLSLRDGRSDGCGVVEFANVEGAKQAVLNLNGTTIMGRRIVVRVTQEDSQVRDPPPTVRNDTTSQSGVEELQSRRVYVNNISHEVSWQDLKDHMRQAGNLVFVGCGMVEFATAEGAKRAVVTLNGTKLMGRQIFVSEDRIDNTIVDNPDVSSGLMSEGGEDAQSNRVYVGNLSYDVVWQDLEDHMSQAGRVLFARVMTNPCGRSKGCGIVEYVTSKEAQEAIKRMMNTKLQGRSMFVREDRAGTSFDNLVGDIGVDFPLRDSGSSVYVGNLNYKTSWQVLKEHMSQVGSVVHVTILTGENGSSKGCGIVQYQSLGDTKRAILKLHKSILNGRTIFIREDREPASGSIK